MPSTLTAVSPGPRQQPVGPVTAHRHRRVDTGLASSSTEDLGEGLGNDGDDRRLARHRPGAETLRPPPAPRVTSSPLQPPPGE